ncbi:DUF4376 domain-containing protein [Avibacterium sp. 20-129]|uniref:DUF4376 domain-containing protein n=1 Tax=Avibacterium sp. 20-129 TaxID=2911525 RepID=UPI0022458C5A|nr:DUF4376 domain-containing protein [Avibacterium sp. 20-129]MCW9698213.1 DUF4376 domain-containing protein [Avibacterium sp. 20-129]
MLVYFKKTDLKQYVIFPKPTNADDYYAVEIDSEAELNNKIGVVVNGEFSLVDTPQAELKVALIEKISELINTKRNECVNGGVYVKQINKWVDTDKAGQDNLVQIKADFDLNGKEQQFSLICADNTVYQLNFDDFLAVWNAVRELKTSMYENAYMHKLLLKNSENPTDYDWSIGWSKTYKEYLEDGN